MKKALISLLLFVGIAFFNSISISAPIQWKAADGGNDHWYEAFAVPGGITWTDAKKDAWAQKFSDHALLYFEVQKI